MRLLAVLLALLPLSGLNAAWRKDIQPESLVQPIRDTIALWESPKKGSEPPSDLAIAVEAPVAIFDTLKALGYYDPEVSLLKDDDSWVLRVQGGQPVRVGQVSVEWLGEAADDRLLRRLEFPLKTGDVLDQVRYEAFKQTLSERMLERGYFDAEWLVTDIALDLQARRADITLRHDSGMRYRFGDILFLDSLGQPLTGLDARWLRAMTPFKPGDEISSRRITELQKTLQASRYFADVRVTLLRDQAEGRDVALEVRADTRKPNRMAVGLGYATDEGPRVSHEWQRHLLNTRGHGISTELQLSPVRQQADLRYRIPWKHPVEDSLQFLAGMQRDRIDDTLNTQTVVGVQRVIQPPRGWQTTYGLRLSEDRFERDGGERGSTTLLMPSVAWSLVENRGGALDPLSGHRQLLQIQAAHPQAFSDAEFVSVRAGSRWLTTVAERHMLLLRADAGAIVSPRFAEVPPSVRFYAGGDSSVRGYDYRALSPVNADGDTVGGQYLVTGSIEYNWRWRPAWRPAVFIDAGNAFDAHWQPLAIGAGAGLRWISPVGPVRVDVASAVSEPGRPLRLHITLGSPL